MPKPKQAPAVEAPEAGTIVPTIEAPVASPVTITGQENPTMIEATEAPAVEAEAPVTVDPASEAPATGEAEAGSTPAVEAEAPATEDKPKNTIMVRKPDGSIITLEKLEDYGEGASDEVTNVTKIAAQLSKQAPYVKQLYRDGKIVITAKTTNLGDDEDPDYVTNFAIAKQDLADYLQAVADGKYKTRDKSNTAYIAKILPGQDDAFMALVAANPTIFASVDLRNKPKTEAEAPATEAPGFVPSQANIEAEADRQARLNAEAPTSPEAPAS